MSGAYRQWPCRNAISVIHPADFDALHKISISPNTVQRRNICEFYQKRRGEFMIFNVASDIVVGALGSGCILAQSHTPLIHSSTRQTLTAGCAQPPEHRNVPLTYSPDYVQVRTLIFGFREWKPLKIRPLVFQLHPAIPSVLMLQLFTYSTSNCYHTIPLLNHVNINDGRFGNGR